MGREIAVAPVACGPSATSRTLHNEVGSTTSIVTVRPRQAISSAAKATREHELAVKQSTATSRNCAGSVLRPESVVQQARLVPVLWTQANTRDKRPKEASQEPA